MGAPGPGTRRWRGRGSGTSVGTCAPTGVLTVTVKGPAVTLPPSMRVLPAKEASICRATVKLLAPGAQPAKLLVACQPPKVADHSASRLRPSLNSRRAVRTHGALYTPLLNVH